MRLVAVLSLVFLCGCGPPLAYGVKSFTGTVPFGEDFVRQEDGSFYIEILGNGLAEYEMLEHYFDLKAEKVCGTDNIAEKAAKRGRHYPDGKLPNTRGGCTLFGTDNEPRTGCPSGDDFPLVYGYVRCRDEPSERAL